MPSWWSKSSSKEAKKNTSKESVSDTFHQKCKIPSDSKPGNRAVGSRRRTSDTISEKGSKSRVVSRSSLPSKQVGRCQSSIDRPQPLPRPGLHRAGVQRSDSGISTSPKTRFNKCAKPSLFRPLLRRSCMRGRPDPADKDEDVVRPSFSSESSINSDYPADSCQRSPLATDCESGDRTAAGSPNYGVMARHQPVVDMKSRDAINRANQVPPGSVRKRNLSSNMSNLQVSCRGTLYSAPDSSLSSPSRSPMRAFGTEQIINSGFWAGKTYPEGSGHCSSPGSGQNSGHNSMGGDMYGQFFCQPSRNSPEYSPIPSPRMTSPGPSSRVQSGAGTPLHPRTGGSMADDGKQSHRLPLPPVTSPVLQSPARMENPASLGSRWKKGKLLGSGTFGHVYVGFNSEKGEMCAMKEVTLFSDDAKSKECAKQLGQEIALLSRLRHPNIVQYYGSETVGDKLYIYLEYVSGGSIHKLLQEYGQLGESAIRSYTKQILSGLAYLHSKNTIHRDIKGANILVDPNGRVKLADFGMAKHITGQSCPLSFKGSPYWMAPEVIQNSNSCSFAVDIWSLGCTVLEMATAKPPWSQYEGVAAMFKIGNSKDLPPIPDHLPDDGKDFIKRCLQRNPMRRPTAVQLLDHSFVKRAATLETPVIFPEPFELPSEVGTRAKAQRYGPVRNASNTETDRLASHSPRVSKGKLYSSGTKTSRNISCPVSPMGSPLLRPRSPQNMNERLSPEPIPSPYTMSGSATPLTGGGGTIPFRHFNQSVYSQESFANKLKPSQCGTYACNTPSYTSANHDLIRGMHSGSQPFRDFPSTEIKALGNQFARPINREMYDGQSVLSDRMSQQLDHAKLGLPSHLSSCSPSRRPMS